MQVWEVTGRGDWRGKGNSFPLPDLLPPPGDEGASWAIPGATWVVGNGALPIYRIGGCTHCVQVRALAWFTPSPLPFSVASLAIPWTWAGKGALPIYTLGGAAFAFMFWMWFGLPFPHSVSECILGDPVGHVGG